MNNSWCESCARKNHCYTSDERPDCYMAITSNDRKAECAISIVFSCNECPHAECPYMKGDTNEQQ